MPWIKKKSNEDFDVPIGCFDGAEYGLAILKGLSGPETERVKKKVITVFEDCRLKITIKANLHIVNFLDITLDLRNNTYDPHRKPDNHPIKTLKTHKNNL